MARRRTVRSLAVAGTALALVLAGCAGSGDDPADTGSDTGGGAADGETYTMIFSHAAAETAPEAQAAETLKEILEEKTDGRITVEVYPNSSLFGQNDQMQALQGNSTQMISASGANFTTIAPQLQVLSLPFLFDSPSDVPEVIDRDSVVGEAIYNNEDLANAGVKVLSIWTAGMKQLGDNEPVRVPEDMAGRSYRIQSSDILTAQFEAWGASPSVIAFSEVYTSLEQGLIDGQENTYSNMETQSMHTVQDYITESNHGFLDQIVAVNLSFYESLPDDLRQALDEALAETAQINYENTVQINEDAKQRILDAGTTEIIELTDDERQQWIDAVIPSVWTQFEDVIGSDVLEYLLDNR